jgi:hypothetical protein
MLMTLRCADDLDTLEGEIRRAPIVTPELMSRVRVNLCTRLPALGTPVRAKIDRLIEAEAWTDAAFALVEGEAPHWKLRRLICDDGEWHCCLSRQPWLPLGFGEAAEGTHEVLALAVLVALIEARRVSAASPARADAIRIPSADGEPVCCENYA